MWTGGSFAHVSVPRQAAKVQALATGRYCLPDTNTLDERAGAVLVLYFTTVLHPSELDVAGGSVVETNQLISSILEDGSGEVLALPDGPVCGRWDLQALVSEAGAEAEVQMFSAVKSSLAAAMRSTDAGGRGNGGYLHTRGQGGPLSTGSDGASCSGCDSTSEIERIEAKIWAGLDAVAALRMRVRQTRYALPLGLLQLRPPSPGGVGGAMDRDVPTSDDVGGPVHGLASDGLDACASADWPALRRAERLTWALAATLIDASDVDQRRHLLGCNSLMERLKMMMLIIQDMKSALSVLAGIARTRS